MTARQRAVLEAFKRLVAARGVPPSVRDIARHFRIQVSAAHRHLAALATKGYLKRRSGGMGLPGTPAIPVPVLTRAPGDAGAEAPADYVSCPAGWGRDQDLFALKVRGDAMAGAGILDADTVICVRDGRAHPGATVVADVAGETVIRRVGRAGGVPALVAAKVPARPIPLHGEARIVGRVLGLFRDLTRRRLPAVRLQ